LDRGTTSRRDTDGGGMEVRIGYIRQRTLSRISCGDGGGGEMGPVLLEIGVLFELESY